MSLASPWAAFDWNIYRNQVELQVIDAEKAEVITIVTHSVMRGVAQTGLQWRLQPGRNWRFNQQEE